MNKNTIKQAAELAGVSVASVSRALNGKPGISEKTRAKIIDICDQLGYQPSEAARRLKIGKTSHVGLLLGPNERQYSHYVSSLFETLNQSLISDGTVLSTYQYDQIESLIKETGAAVLTGIEDSDSRPSRLKKAGVPFVSVGKSNNNFWVCPDDQMGGRLAAEHLYSLGCSKPVIIESKLEGKGTKARSVGFQSYFQNKSILPANLYIDHQSSIELNTYRSVSKLLNKQAFQFDSVFCENDEIAYGVILACQDFGLNIPRQIKVVGFDDLPNLYSEITTVKQDIKQIAISIVELLDKAKRQGQIEQVELPVELVVRASTVDE